MNFKLLCLALACLVLTPAAFAGSPKTSAKPAQTGTTKSTPSTGQLAQPSPASPGKVNLPTTAKPADTSAAQRPPASGSDGNADEQTSRDKDDAMAKFLACVAPGLNKSDDVTAVLVPGRKGELSMGGGISAGEVATTIGLATSYHLSDTAVVQGYGGYLTSGAFAVDAQLVCQEPFAAPIKRGDFRVLLGVGLGAALDPNLGNDLSPYARVNFSALGGVAYQLPSGLEFQWDLTLRGDLLETVHEGEAATDLLTMSVWVRHTL